MDFTDKILEAKEKFSEKSMEIMLEDLDVEQWDEKALLGCCAINPNHKDTHPSMHWDKKNNCFRCFSCGAVYGILDHYQSQGLSFKESTKKLFKNAEVEYTIDTFKSSVNAEHKHFSFEGYKYPREEMNKDRSNVNDYLVKRGITVETLDFAGIKENGNEEIVFEHRDIDGKLLRTKYRNAGRAKEGAKYRWQPNTGSAPVLYGVDKISDVTKPLLIVEGHIDRLACIEAGYKNVTSIPDGAQSLKWIDFNWDWLNLFNEIILWADNDDAGKKMITDATKRLDSFCCKVVMPTEEVEQAVVDYYKSYGAKENKTDANNVLLSCGAQQVLDLINNAKEVSDAEIKDLMSYNYYSIQDREIFSTGIKTLDYAIHGHLLNCLTLYTGYTGCVDNKTEYFNGSEWKSIADYTDGEQVLQYNVDGTSNLISPSKYIKENCNEFFLIKTSKGINQCVTKEHNLVYKTSRKNIAKKGFEEFRDMHNSAKSGFTGHFVTSFDYSGNYDIPLTDDEIKLMIAVSADGTYSSNTNRCRIRIKKKRKQRRLKYLLDKCNISYDMRIYNETNTTGFQNFMFNTPQRFKVFPKEWLKAKMSQRKIIFDEIFKWDGTQSKLTYYSTIKENADFVQLIISSLGYRGSLKIDDRESKGNICYSVLATIQNQPRLMNHNSKYKITNYNDHDGYKYCFTVPSGMLVLRRENVINITGNSGKTTAINQVALKAFLELDEQVFVFSGEMGGDKLMSWLLDSMAGRNHIIEWDNGAEKPKGYSVSKQAIAAMQKHYSGRIKNYDKRGVVTTEALLNKMEYCRRRYGIKHFFVDNLMCLLSKGDSNDKWESQIEFIIKLANFAEDKGVGVHLVAHPKKPASGAEEVNSIYDISGASELVNACNRAFWIKKVLNKEHQSEIKVLKDRETMSEGKVIKLNYDVMTRRLYSTPQEQNERCSWELNTQINYPNAVKDRIVSNIYKATSSIKNDNTIENKKDKELFGEE